MGDNKKLFANAAVFFVSSAVSAAIPFLLLPVLTRVLSPSDYGVVAMFGVVLSVLGAFTGLSVHGAINVRYFQIEKGELSQYVTTCLLILTGSTVIVLGAVAFSRQWLAAEVDVPPNWLLLAVMVSGVQFVLNIRLGLWQVAGVAKRYGAFQVGQALVDAALSLLLVLAVGMSWQGRLAGQVIAITIFGFFGLYWLRRDGYLAPPCRWRKHAVDALKFGIPLVPHTIGSLLIATTDRMMVAKMLGLDKAGVYMVALQIGMGMTLITMSLNKVYAPWLMENLAKLKRDEDSARRIVTLSYFCMLSLIAAALLIGFLAPVIMHYLVGERFWIAGPIVIYVALACAFHGCYFIVANYIFFAGKTGWLAWITFLSGVINVPLMYLMIKYNGLMGAGQSFMAVEALALAGTWVTSHRVYPMPWLAFFRK